MREPAGRGGLRHGVQGVRRRQGAVLHGEDGCGRGGHGRDAGRVQDAKDAQPQELHQVVRLPDGRQLPVHRAGAGQGREHVSQGQEGTDHREDHDFLFQTGFFIKLFKSLVFLNFSLFTELA